MCLHIQHMCVFVCVRATSPYLTGCAFENTLVCECVFVYAPLHSGLHNELTGCGLCINQNYKYGCRTRATFPFGSLLILIYVWHHLGTGGEPPCNGWFYYLSACYMYIILFTSSFMHNYCVHSDAQIGGQSPTVAACLFSHSLNSKSRCGDRVRMSCIIHDWPQCMELLQFPL